MTFTMNIDQNTLISFTLDEKALEKNFTERLAYVSLEAINDKE